MTPEPHPDSWRAYFLYRYLLGCLAISRRTDRTPNASKTATRVGDRELRKLVVPLFESENAWHDAIGPTNKATKATTGRVVGMLSALRVNLQSEYREHLEPYSRVLNTEDILIALHQLIELTPEERNQLGLPAGDGLTLLKQTLLALQTNGGIENYEAIFRAYKEAVGLEFSNESSAIENLDQIDDIIDTSVRQALSYLPDRQSTYLNGKASSGKEETIRDLSRKAQREIRRLLARSGNTQAFLPDGTTKHPYIQQYLQPAFVKKLTKTVVNNERLTDQFPVYLKRLTMEACGPLPFADTKLGDWESGKSYPPLLNEELQRLDGSANYKLHEQIPGPSDYELASQGATKITLEFYIKVPEAYQSKTPKAFEKLASSSPDTNDPHRRVDFVVSSTGIGGTLSHVIKAINITLLSDIPCLSSFFPIAHDVASTQAIIRDNVPSPVWAHSLVNLCHRDSVGQALGSFEDGVASYDRFSFNDPIGHGDFCGFDFLLAQAQSALHARLQAIRTTGISPDDYIEQLCEKVERQLMLDDAWHQLQRYPFSSMAMIGPIHETIIGKFFKSGLLQGDSAYIYFDAYLSITEILLDEGAYRASAVYLKELKVLDDYVHEGLANLSSVDVGRDSCVVFSGTLIIRYLLCLATYYYLFDISDSDRSCLPHTFPLGVSRAQLVQTAWEALALARRHVETRLKKYIVIGEISQGTFHPHYALLGRLYFIRAKLLTFFPRLVPRDEVALPTENFAGQQRTAASVHWGRLYLLEKARLYIAADGNSAVYSYYAAMQSCLYLVAAYDSPQNLSLTDAKTGLNHTTSRENCLEWAKTLRNHALITYADTGRQCYYTIKEKSGLPQQFDDFGHYHVEKIPAIFESRNPEQIDANNETDQFLTLDISLLGINSQDIPKLTPKHPTGTIYLFGTNACHLFFARGLYLLCSDTTEEFIKHEPPTDIQWAKKMSQAMRLLDMAWAIAEDGCDIKKEKGEGITQRTVTRSFRNSGTEHQYASKEIDSVRDLYPRRVNEIADLGKIFSAACMVLRLHTVPFKARGEMMEDIAKILNMIHGEYKLRGSKTLRALISRQTRYNGHIEDYLLSARSIIESYIPKSNNPSTSEDIKMLRDELLQDLFSALLI